MTQSLPLAAPDALSVLTKAALNAGARLGLSAREMAEVLGVSEATISGIRRHGRNLPADPKGLEIAKLFIRLYRSLDAITGGEDAVSRAWLRGENTALRGIPAERIRSITGLVDVLAYLDQRRAVA